MSDKIKAPQPAPIDKPVTHQPTTIEKVAQPEVRNDSDIPSYLTRRR